MISLGKKEVLGWLLARYRFAIGVVREIDKGEERQCLALIPRGVSCTESAEELKFFVISTLEIDTSSPKN